MNVFQRALLDVVLAEYPEPESSDLEASCDSIKYSVWVDKKNLHLYFTRQDGCVQHFFPAQENLDTFVRYLKMQGYTPK